MSYSKEPCDEEDDEDLHCVQIYLTLISLGLNAWMCISGPPGAFIQNMRKKFANFSEILVKQIQGGGKNQKIGTKARQMGIKIIL